MKHALPHLDGLKVFESAARYLSFSEAAKELCITKSAVSYQIKKLESELNCPLFKRNIRQVLLTDAGQKLYQTTQKAFSDLSATIDHLNSWPNTITIAATTYVAARWLSPLVTDFCQMHPQISLEFKHSVNSSQFKLDEVDLAIQWSECHNEINGNRLMELPMPLFPVCSPALMDQIGQQGGSMNFANATLLCEDRDLDLWKEWAAEGYELDSNPRRLITDANVRVQAAIDGQGLVLADAMMQSELNSGALVIVSGQELTGYGYVLLSTVVARRNSLVNELIQWLTRC